MSAHMLDDDVRCRECGYVGPAGTYERWALPGEVSDAHYLSRPVKWVDCCESCRSQDITDRPACVRCELNDATDDDYCHTCAIAIDTDDLLVESRAGLDRISDLHQTILDCARGLR